jgi:hypothetical protein
MVAGEHFDSMGIVSTMEIVGEFVKP